MPAGTGYGRGKNKNNPLSVKVRETMDKSDRLASDLAKVQSTNNKEYNKKIKSASALNQASRARAGGRNKYTPGFLNPT